MGSTVNILLVDDDEVDVQGAQARFQEEQDRQTRSRSPVTASRPWRSCAARTGHAKLPRPHLILLDLNMPRA